MDRVLAKIHGHQFLLVRTGYSETIFFNVGPPPTPTQQWEPGWFILISQLPRLLKSTLGYSKTSVVSSLSMESVEVFNLINISIGFQLYWGLKRKYEAGECPGCRPKTPDFPQFLVLVVRLEGGGGNVGLAARLPHLVDRTIGCTSLHLIHILRIK